MMSQSETYELQCQYFCCDITFKFHSLDYFQMVKAGLILGLFGGTQKFVNDKVEISRFVYVF